MSTYTSFAKAALERAVKTFAQSLAALLIADGTDLLGTNWTDRLSVAGMAAVVSILTSIASASFGTAGPSLAGETVGATAKLDPASPSGESAADASLLPTDAPVETVPVLDVPQSSDTKADAVGGSTAVRRAKQTDQGEW